MNMIAAFGCMRSGCVKSLIINNNNRLYTSPNFNFRILTGSIIPYIVLWTIYFISFNPPLFLGRYNFFALAIIILASLLQVNVLFTSDIALT